ncbi:hypothetical protein EV361DRAFT_979112 [Lentinula raphanica]|uniref:RING-type domain-containing protein n=1 Tax=Lentinula raphanica TaxID=153919 RepID=A0AA38PJ22_9AGAR|nr:hypothetical protein F5878DRAFT_604233 [Lentinula raphanica]KAJ3973387.1 hypothetical protein EV361DRAFT_979112 [Lentinula raphanica]
MTKHSKNNTASSIFSYAEYKKLDYGTKKQRLGHESMRRFDACALCLNRAREPLACNEGHLFCKECVYTDLLTQKKDIKRQKEKLELMKKDAQEERERAKLAARERVLREFEKGQLGLGVNSKPSATGVGASTGEKDVGEANSSNSLKRKFNFSSSALESLTLEAEEAALRQIEVEQREALKAKLPDFWLPSLTPTYTGKGDLDSVKSLEDVKLQTTCRGGNPKHVLTMKSLVPVKFTFEASGKLNVKESDQQAICPSCKKVLSNNTLIYLSKPCAHVTCKTCTDTLVRPAKQCVVCDTVLKIPDENKGDKDGKNDIIELRREGTGFAGGGMAETSKAGVAFQG